MIIDQLLMDSLTSQAKDSPRLRKHLDLRNSESDGSQRMLNAIEPGSQLNIHRHLNSSETIVCLRGRLVEEFFDDLCTCVKAIEISPFGPVVAVNIPIGQWHRLRSLESGSVVLSCKDGQYEPISSDDVLNGKQLL